MGRRLAAEVASVERLEPRLTTDKLLAFGIAAGVHVLTALIFVAGVLAIAFFPTNAVAIVVGAFLIAVAMVIRPRLSKPPEEDLVTRAEAQALWGLVDEVAASLSTPPPQLLVVDHQFNAYWGVVGIRRRRVLGLGLPLLSSLEPQERVGLVAHELAHARNGDASRGIFVGSAVGGLAHLYYLLAPDRYNQGLGIAEHVANGILWLLSRPAYWLLHLEYHLLLHETQRAEYLADALAARVAGTEAVVLVHEKLLLEPSFRAVVQEHAHPATAANADLFEATRLRFGSVPERERTRRRRVAMLEESRLSDTHPPTGMRIRLLEQRPPQAPEVTLDRERSDQIDAELRRLRSPLGERLVELHKASLYHR
jgi:Zn-dependent protease with chaperone function